MAGSFFMAMHHFLAILLDLTMWLVMRETIWVPHSSFHLWIVVFAILICTGRQVAICADNQDFNLLQRILEPEDVTLPWMGALA
jgi:hypothetical protein